MAEIDNKGYNIGVTPKKCNEEVKMMWDFLIGLFTGDSSEFPGFGGGSSGGGGASGSW